MIFVIVGHTIVLANLLAKVEQHRTAPPTSSDYCKKPHKDKNCLKVADSFDEKECHVVFLFYVYPERTIDNTLFMVLNNLRQAELRHDCARKI